MARLEQEAEKETFREDAQYNDFSFLLSSSTGSF